MYGVRFKGARYDIGNKMDFIKTNVVFGLKRKDLKQELAAFVRELAGTLGGAGGKRPRPGKTK